MNDAINKEEIKEKVDNLSEWLNTQELKPKKLRLMVGNTWYKIVKHELSITKTLEKRMQEEQYMQTLYLEINIKPTQDYIDYLDKALDKVALDLKEYNGSKLQITTNYILQNIRMHEISNFIWPQIIHNQEEGIVMVWPLGEEYLRLELYSTELYYATFICNEPIEDDSFENALVYLSNKVNDLNIDWKKTING